MYIFYNLGRCLHTHTCEMTKLCFSSEMCCKTISHEMSLDDLFDIDVGLSFVQCCRSHSRIGAAAYDPMDDRAQNISSSTRHLR
jgi:hypothetical protein